MKATIVYDNTCTREDLIANWGFACHIEMSGKKILFDAGADGEILLHNLRQLEIDPGEIDEVFISHNHFDHIGGLATVLNKNNQVKIYLPPSLRGVRNAREVVYVQEPTRLDENMFSSGELAGIEQSLAIETAKGLVLFLGCCYGSRYFGGSVPHTGRGNRGTSRQPDSAHGQRILALRMCQGASFAGSRLLLDTFYAPVKSDHERHPAPMPDHGTMSLEFRRT